MKKVHQAFTLLEIMVVMVIVIAMTTIIGPWLIKKRPQADWSYVLSQFNDLVTFASQESISGQKTYRLLFKSNKGEPDFILVQKKDIDPQDPEKEIYTQVYSDYIKTRYELPSNVKMVDFYKSREEEFEKDKGRAYCYVISTGLVQDAMIHLIRIVDGKESRVTFKMSPFQAKFELFEGYLKPER